METLPRPHPFAPFAASAEAFAARECSSPLRRKLLCAALGAWHRMFRVGSHERRIADDFAEGRDGFRFDAYAMKELFYPQTAASFVLADDGEHDGVKKAAQLLLAALRFRERLLRGELETEHEAKRPLDMARYAFFFSRVMVSSHQGKRLLHENRDAAPVDHVVVGVDGFLYALDVYTNGRLRPYAEICDELGAIKDDAAAQAQKLAAERSPFGILTTLNDDSTTPLSLRLRTENEEAFQTLDSALLFLALDPAAAPQTLDGVIRSIHTDHYYNRDPRRSLQIVVTGNGRAGLVVNPAAGLGGTLSAKLASDLFVECRNIRRESLADATAPRDGRRSPHILDIGFADPAAHRPAVDATREAIRARLYPRGACTAFRLDGCGRRDFLARGLSPDGAFHCAIRLAYKKTFRREPTVGNFVNLRQVRHGDIWRYPANSEAMTRFVADPSPATLRAAVERHKELIKVQKLASDEAYLGTLTLAQLYSRGQLGPFGLASLILLLALFIENFVGRFLDPDLWLSQIPEFEGLEVSGRAGVKLGFLERKNTFGGHYMIFDDHVKVCFVKGRQDPQTAHSEAAFAANLRDALAYVRTLASGVVTTTTPQRVEVVNVHSESSANPP